MALAIALDHTSRSSTVAVAGDLDIASSDPLAAFLTAEVGQSGRDLVIDLRQLTFLDAAGLRVFVSVSQLLAEGGRVLSIVGSDPRVLRVFLLTGLQQALNVHVQTADGEPDPEPVAA
jgi:anti-sigma B factor antagonist